MKKIYFGLLLASSLFSCSLYALDFDRKAMVAAHNKWRADAGVKEKLTYSPELEILAQTWVNKLQKDNRCAMKHSAADGVYGENLYWASSIRWSDGRHELKKVTPEQVADAWGAEKAAYNYVDNSCRRGEVCGHYTQMVWRSTRKIGCAVAVCKDTQEQVWACEYEPAGNWVGSRPF